MVILGLILLLVGSLVPLDPRAKNALIICGVVLLVIGVVLIIAPGEFSSWNWPIYRR